MKLELPGWAKPIYNVLVFMLALCQILLLFSGLGMIALSIIMTAFPSVLVPGHEANLTSNIIDHMTKNNYNISESNTQHDTVKKVTKEMLIFSYPIYSGIGFYFLCFGIAVFIGCIIGILSFAKENMIMIFCYALLSLVTFINMIVFLINLEIKVSNAADHALLEVLETLNPKLCSICWYPNVFKVDDTNSYEVQRNNIYFIGMATYKCCGVTKNSDVQLESNKTGVIISLLPMTCCSPPQPFDNMCPANKFLEPCLRVLVQYYLTQTPLRFTTFELAPIMAMLVFLILVSVPFGVRIMYLQNKYCFRVYRNRLVSNIHDVRMKDRADPPAADKSKPLLLSNLNSTDSLSLVNSAEPDD